MRKLVHIIFILLLLIYNYNLVSIADIDNSALRPNYKRIIEDELTDLVGEVPRNQFLTPDGDINWTRVRGCLFGNMPDVPEEEKGQLKHACRLTLRLIEDRGIALESKLISQSAHYIWQCLKADVFHTLDNFYAPAAIFWSPASKVTIYPRGGDPITKHHIVVLYKGSAGTSRREVYGLRTILADSCLPGIQQTGEVKQLIRRIITNGERMAFSDQQDNRTSYFVYRDGTNIYELEISPSGCIIGLNILPPRISSIAAGLNISLARADKIDLIVNHKFPPDYYAGTKITGHEEKRINRLLGVKTNFYPKEVFLDESTNQCFIMETTSGDVLVINNEGYYLGFLSKINPAVFFAFSNYRRMSSKIIRDYEEHPELNRWREEGQGLKARAEAIAVNYPDYKRLALLSWSRVYEDAGILIPSIPLEPWYDFLAGKIGSYQDLSPVPGAGVARIYLLPGANLAVLPHGFKKDGLGLGLSYIREIPPWNNCSDDEISDFLRKTLLSAQARVISGNSLIYIYLEGRKFYLAIVDNGLVTRFNVAFYESLGLFHLGICQDYDMSFVLCKLLNNQPVKKPTREQAETGRRLCTLDKQPSNLLARRVFYHRREEILYVYSSAPEKENCLVIDKTGRFRRQITVTLTELSSPSYQEATTAVIRYGSPEITAARQQRGNSFMNLRPIIQKPSAVSFDWRGVLSLLETDREDSNGIIELLTKLKAAGIKIYIITSGRSPEEITRCLQILGIESYIEKVICTRSEGSKVPHRQPPSPRSKRDALAEIKKKLGLVSPSQIAHFDDTPFEIATTGPEAVTFAVLPPDSNRFESMVRARPNYITVDFKNIIPVLEALGLDTGNPPSNVDHREGTLGAETARSI